MKHLFYFIYILPVVLALVLTSCRDEPAIDPEPEIPPTDLAPRTVLVYMAADNNLGSGNFDRSDINEMCIGAASANLGTAGRLIVYQSAYSKPPVLMEILPDRIDTLLNYEYGTPAVARSRMEDVIASTRELAPARKYGIVLWGHGTGWLQDGISGESAAYAYGPEQNKGMNISTLAEILTEAGCFDYIYFDCCFMQSVETLYELRHAADYVVGSVSELPSDGMDYSLNLEPLLGGTEADLIQAARNTFGVYDALYGIYRTCTMSVIATAALDRLAAATSAVYSRAQAFAPAGYSPQCFAESTSYFSKYYFDFKDYVLALAEAYDIDSSEFESAFAQTVLYSASTPYLWNSVDLSRNNGLSTYILAAPLDINTKNYRTLQWYRDVVTAFNLF